MARSLTASLPSVSGRFGAAAPDDKAGGTMMQGSGGSMMQMDKR